MKEGYKWICKDRKKSPSIGVPVYVKDEVLTEKKFPYDHRGGVIVEDMSLEDNVGNTYHYFYVKHKNGTFLWPIESLVEIGGLKIE
jgi:hypothetical protein